MQDVKGQQELLASHPCSRSDSSRPCLHHTGEELKKSFAFRHQTPGLARGGNELLTPVPPTPPAPAAAAPVPSCSPSAHSSLQSSQIKKVVLPPQLSSLWSKQTLFYPQYLIRDFFLERLNDFCCFSSGVLSPPPL